MRSLFSNIFVVMWTLMATNRNRPIYSHVCLYLSNSNKEQLVTFLRFWSANQLNFLWDGWQLLWTPIIVWIFQVVSDTIQEHAVSSPLFLVFSLGKSFRFKLCMARRACARVSRLCSATLSEDLIGVAVTLRYRVPIAKATDRETGANRVPAVSTTIARYPSR